MTPIYIVALLVCVLFFLVAHFRAPKSDFYLGHRGYGVWISAASVVAAFTGGSAIVNTTGLAAAYGHWAFFDVLPAVLGLFLSAILVAVGFFGKRFSSAFFDVSVYSKQAVNIHYVQIAFLYTLVIAAQFRAVATVAGQLDIDPWIAVGICGLTVGAYAFRGFHAVTRTDIAQLVLMVPMYIVIAYLAADGETVAQEPSAQSDMPWALAAALCLPFLFLPISQELHQRGAAAKGDETIGRSYLIAGTIYLILASTLVLAFSARPGMGIGDIIRGNNPVGACLLIIGVTAAILSTLDTSTNVASHAAQKLHFAERLPPWVAQAILLGIGAAIYLLFPTVLALILFALFVYIAGPAFTFVAVYGGLHPRTSAFIGGAFVVLHLIVQLRVVTAPSFETVREILPAVEPIHLGLALIVLQGLILLSVAVFRRLR